MSSDIFGGCLLGPSASHLLHKPREMHHMNHYNTDPTNPELTPQLLPSKNGSLTSIIDHISQGKRLVWFDCRVFNAFWCDLITPSLHVHDCF